MGKFGGREPNYHSDLDIVFLYEAVGSTRHRRAEKSTSNQHFFDQLGQRITTVLSQLGPHGRLYEVDSRLRPTGTSGTLAVSLDELDRYFSEGQGLLWERQALCKARVIYGSAEVAERTMQVVRGAIVEHPWQAKYASEIRDMRMRLQETASPNNLKRGAGGTMDIEFVVQLLQLRHMNDSPGVFLPGTLDAIDSLREAGFLTESDADHFAESYRFLRSVEARLRLMNTASRHDIPTDAKELKKLAFMLGSDGPDSLCRDIESTISENRRAFDRILNALASKQEFMADK